MNINKQINNDKIFSELINNQRKIISDKKLMYNDLKRISKYLTTSIFNNDCSLWNGYITIIKKDTKNSYINFYYCGKKYSLHRLLYINYIGDIQDSEYIKFKCNNKGKCCNINHFYKNNKNEDNESKSSIPTTPIDISDDISKEQPNNIIVDFTFF
jgi:hypothetical protein